MNVRNDHEQDMIEAQYLFDVLEQEVLPVFAGTTERHTYSWTELMKKSIMALAPRFSSARMVKEYHDRIYAPNTPHS
jgi:starch phosphorylase